MPLKIKKFVHLYRNETVPMIRCYVRSKVTGIPRRGLDPWPWNAPKLTGKLTMPSYGHASFSEEDTILATLLVAVTKCLADAIEGRKEESLFFWLVVWADAIHHREAQQWEKQPLVTSHLLRKQREMSPDALADFLLHWIDWVHLSSSIKPFWNVFTDTPRTVSPRWF